jgi:uncharacterized protein YjbJ (UPF0337 family)
MSGKTDIIKGQIKEAAGVLTGNDSLREEGRTDQAIGEVKEAANQVAADAHTAVGKTKPLAQQTVDKTKDAAKRMCD